MRLIKWKDCTQDNNISATGQRTAKHVFSSSDVFEHSDYYVYDASGNLMSVYRKFSDANEQVLSYSLTERPMYGSSRLGVDKTTIEFIGYTPPTNGLTNHVVGLKQYEGSNHLGNVLTTFSDKKMPVDANSDGIIDYSTANITSSTDYYPFGVTMKARDFTSNVSRFGFNGKEKDEETETMDFGARLLDGDLGGWLACDPEMAKYPDLSSYNYCANNPIMFIDPDGKRIYAANEAAIAFMNNLIKKTFGENSGFTVSKDGYVLVNNKDFKKAMEGWDSDTKEVAMSFYKVVNDQKYEARVFVGTKEGEEFKDSFTQPPYGSSTKLVIPAPIVVEGVITGGSINAFENDEDYNTYGWILINPETLKNTPQDILKDEGVSEIAPIPTFFHELLDHFLSYMKNQILNPKYDDKKKEIYFYNKSAKILHNDERNGSRH